MASLTDARLKKAQATLDRHSEKFLATHYLNSGLLEKELKEVWNVGYQEIKGIMIDLSKIERYALLAVRYMEGEAPGVVSEFKGTLAKFYGLKHYNAAEREEKQREFWEKAFRGHKLPYSDVTFRDKPSNPNDLADGERSV